MNDLALTAAILGGAALLQGVVGFGFGMVSMGLLPFVMPVETAVPAVALLALATNVVVLAANRRGLSRASLAPMLLGGVAGVPLGILFLHEASPRVLHAALGCVLLGYSLHALVATHELDAPPTPHTPLRETAGAVAGLLGGALGAAFNTGGPPVSVYVTWRRFAPATTKASLQAFFLVTAVYQIGLYAATGTFTAASLRAAGVGLPALGAGLGAGLLLARRLDAARYRRLVLVLLAALGVRFLVA